MIHFYEDLSRHYKLIGDLKVESRGTDLVFSHDYSTQCPGMVCSNDGPEVTDTLRIVV